MQIGTVVGHAVATVKHASLTGWRLLLVQLLTTDGKPDGEFKIPALTADVDRTTGHLWVVTEEELLKVDRKGEVRARAKHKASTKHAWIAAY